MPTTVDDNAALINVLDAIARSAHWPLVDQHTCPWQAKRKRALFALNRNSNGSTRVQVRSPTRVRFYSGSQIVVGS